MTDLVVINPNALKQVYGKLSQSLAAIAPPLWAALLAGFIRNKGYEVKVIDAEAENLSPAQTVYKLKEYNPQLTVIVVLGSTPSASSTPKMTVVRELLKEIRAEKLKMWTALVGIHPSALPVLTLRETGVDMVFQGEGFQPTLDFLAKRPFIYCKFRELIDINTLPIAAWDLLPMDKYKAHNWHCFDDIDKRQPYGLLYSSLGCPYSCHYCNVHLLYNGKPNIRYRNVDNFIKELDYLVGTYKIRNFKIIDELFAIREDRTLALCDAIIKKGYDLNMWVNQRVDTVNLRMLKKMKEAGINWIAYGIESANEEVRTAVGKKYEQDVLERTIEATREAGINIIGNFVFGLPEDNLETMQETLDLAKELQLEYIDFYAAMAYPGSKLYESAVLSGMKLPDDWYGYSQLNYETLPMATKYLTSAQVLQFRDNAFKEYMTDPKYLKMIKGKFGDKVVKHIKEILKYDLPRKILGD